MKIHPFNKPVIRAGVLAAGLITGTGVMADPGLEQILLKKGILTQNDVIRIHSGTAIEDVLMEKGVISKSEWSELKLKQKTTVAQHTAPASASKEEKSGYSVSTGKKGFLIKSDDGDFEFGVGGRVQADTAYFFPNEPYGNGAEIRRVRLKGYGKIWHDWKYKAEIDFADGAELTDGWLAYTGFDPFTIKIGHQKVPFTLQSSTSSNWQVFQERALMDAFIDTAAHGRRRLGITASWHGGYNFFVHTGIFGQGAHEAGAFNQSWGTATRVAWDPILEDDKLLHVGGSMYYRDFNSNAATEAVTFRARPESHISGIRLADTGSSGIPNADSTIMGGAEASGIWGPFHAQGEFVDVTVGRNNGSADLNFDSWYVQLGYFLTGESRHYDHKSGQFKGVSPNSIVGAGGYGAWEVAARFSYIDMNSNGFEGGRERDFTLGLNWWANQNILFRLNYINAYAYPSSSASSSTFSAFGGTNQTVNIIEGRAQIVF